MATTSTLPEGLEVWATKVFFDEYNMLPTIWDQLLNVVPSKLAFEDTWQASGLGTFTLKPEGTPISYSDPVQSLRKRVVHSTYALGFRATMELMADEQYGIIKRMPQDLGKSAADHRERLAHGLFNTAFVNTTHTGLPEGDTTRRQLCVQHTQLNGGTYSNALAPAVALSVSGLESAVTNMRLTVDENGRQIVVNPSVVFTHPNEEFNAAQLLDSTQEPFTSDNQVNATSSSRLGVRHMQSPYLTSTTAWFLLSDKSGHDLKWYDRMPVTFERDKDSQTKDALFDAMYRASVTFDDWRGVVGSNA
jgi:phage major head subunit gpT-like protein